MNFTDPNGYWKVHDRDDKLLFVSEDGDTKDNLRTRTCDDFKKMNIIQGKDIANNKKLKWDQVRVEIKKNDLTKNVTLSYVLYIPDEVKGALRAAIDLRNYFGQNSFTSLLEVKDASSFKNHWNNGIAQNKAGHGTKVKVGGTVILSHGNPGELGTTNRTVLIDIMGIYSLKEKEMSRLIILGCNTGHFDHKANNLASNFVRIIKGGTVAAPDGTTVANWNFWKTERYYTPKNDSVFRDLCSKKRDPKGWLAYNYNSKTFSVSVSASFGQKLTVHEILRKMR